jgi:excisionase family DNA binding protein
LTSKAFESKKSLMTVQDVAEYLNLRTSWIYGNWQAQGLPAIKVGRGLRFRREDVDAWIDSNVAVAA